MARDEDGYEIIPKYESRTIDMPKGLKCGECGMRFEHNRVYGYCCPKTRCPMGFGGPA